MSEAPAPTGGFAARLLDRAEGRVTALRPGIAPVFAAEQARAAPVLERSEDAPTALADQAEQGEARAELPRSPAATAGSPAPEFRLMPVSSERAESRQVAEPQPDTEGEPAALRPDPAQANQPAAPHLIAAESLAGNPTGPRRLRPAPKPPRLRLRQPAWRRSRRKASLRTRRSSRKPFRLRRKKSPAKILIWWRA